MVKFFTSENKIFDSPFIQKSSINNLVVLIPRIALRVFKDGAAERVAAVVGLGSSVLILNTKNGKEQVFQNLPDGGSVQDLEIELNADGRLQQRFTYF